MPSFGDPVDFEGIIFPPHAQEKMEERNVDMDGVTKTLYRPDRVYPGNKPGRRVAERDEPGGSMVRVVYVIEDAEEAMEKIWPEQAAAERRTREERGIQYEPHLAAVVVTVIRIKKRRRDR